MRILSKVLRLSLSSHIKAMRVVVLENKLLAKSWLIDPTMEQSYEKAFVQHNDMMSIYILHATVHSPFLWFTWEGILAVASASLISNELFPAMPLFVCRKNIQIKIHNAHYVAYICMCAFHTSVLNLHFKHKERWTNFYNPRRHKNNFSDSTRLH